MGTAEIVMFDNYIVTYKFVGDLMFFVTGSQDENELVLYTVLQAFYESVSLLLRYVMWRYSNVWGQAAEKRGGEIRQAQTTRMHAACLTC